MNTPGPAPLWILRDFNLSTPANCRKFNSSNNTCVDLFLLSKELSTEIANIVLVTKVPNSVLSTNLELYDQNNNSISQEIISVEEDTTVGFRCTFLFLLNAGFYRGELCTYNEDELVPQVSAGRLKPWTYESILPGVLLLLLSACFYLEAQSVHTRV